MKRIDDSCLYTEDALAVAFIIGWPARVCSRCGQTLPANRDYYAPASKGYGGELKCECRRCGRAADRRRWAAQKAAG